MSALPADNKCRCERTALHTNYSAYACSVGTNLKDCNARTAIVCYSLNLDALAEGCGWDHGGHQHVL